MFNPIQQSPNQKTKVKHLDFSHLALKHISPTASYVTLTSPTTRESETRFPYTKTSASSPRNGPPKYNLYERNRSVNALPLIHPKASSVVSSMENIQELKTEEKEAAFYMLGSSVRPKKTKPDDSSTYGLGQLSMYKVNITRDQYQQPAPCPPLQQEPLLETPEKGLKSVQSESPRSRNAFLFKTKGYFDIETLAKTGLKSPSNKKSEGSPLNKELKEIGQSRNTSMIKNISLKDRSNQPSQSLKASLKLDDVLKGFEEIAVSTNRRVDLSPESGYLLSDRQRVEKANSNKKRNLKINLDSQVIKCFGDIRSTVGGSLTQRPQLNKLTLFPLYTSHKRFPNAARMDMSMIKDLCKDVVLSGKKSGIMNL